MSEPRFTKGPYQRADLTVYVLGDNGCNRWSARVSHDFSGVSDEELRAVAQLFRTAPDLYEAAAAALGLLTGNMDGDLPEDSDPIEMLRAALAKAGAAGGEG